MTRLNYLLEGYISANLKPEELKEFLILVDQNEEEISMLIHNLLASGEFANNTKNPVTQERIYNKITEAREASAAPSSHRVHFLKTSWFRYAAAIILLFGAGTWLILSNTKSNQQQVAGNNKKNQTNIGPGGEKAILTLADGTTIVLDNAANGNLAEQGGVQVIKLANGQISYNLKFPAGKEVLWNTMSTPKGGQYQVNLPDGSKVWLNAASSITFPTRFEGNERKVKIVGEAYFEVIADKQKPFIVDINGKAGVQVLGTSFNINSYSDENTIRATLIEGKVRFSNTSLTGSGNASTKIAHDKSNVTLKPGQQAKMQLHNNGLEVNHVNIEQTMAWKNGLFDFNGSDLHSVMRQLEKWYDLEVKFEGDVPNTIFVGEMYRNANLSDVLDMFHKMGVNCRIDGRTLIITE